MEIRARGNITLAGDVDFDTLRVWYNRHNIVGSREVYLQPPVGVKGSKGSSFCLELFIHEDRVSPQFNFLIVGASLLSRFSITSAHQRMTTTASRAVAVSSGQRARSGNQHLNQSAVGSDRACQKVQFSSSNNLFY